MRKRRYYPGILALAAAVTVAPAGIGTAWSYFTTYAEAAGGYTIRLGDRTEITEDFTDWTKHVVIANEESAEPVYIRVRAFCGSQYTIVYSGEGWTLGSDGYYYYNTIVNGGGTTAPLDLKIEGISEEPEAMESFNVVVIYESTPVKHHEDGTPYSVQETDWSEILDTGSTVSTGKEEDDRETENAGTGRTNDSQEGAVAGSTDSQEDAATGRSGIQEGSTGGEPGSREDEDAVNSAGTETGTTEGGGES